MIFFTDECFSVRLAHILEIFDRENTIRALEDDFDKGTQDETWLPKIAKWSEKPVVISGDGRILKQADQRAILRECDLSFVYVHPSWQRVPWDDYVIKFLKAWRDLVQSTGRVKNPSLFEVSINSKVKLLH